MPWRLSRQLTKADLWQARLLPWRTLLLGSLIAVWVGSGLASLQVSAARSEALLSGLGLTGELRWG
jgi:hypothetical protein